MEIIEENIPVVDSSGRVSIDEGEKLIIGDQRNRITRIFNSRNLGKFVSVFLIVSLLSLVSLFFIFLLILFVLTILIPSFYEVLSDNIFVFCGDFSFYFSCFEFPLLF